ncbi:hypothetical protein TRFO_28518 [Tritrichomonas foetus]|uniref:Calcineurin-like phosphoesterase domain-containing protein n=1 Tax=Tritrichomonas foetus TaxID=1144522 RepID=A0A1J4K2Q4_9EUKA|nr:hypothetical protein TRFO_28518 [Tritrichomonas foetus]|eukprot:OHT04028.1 hypothetical protein TRFO_28518 [Tritrichomonas foetus]
MEEQFTSLIQKNAYKTHPIPYLLLQYLWIFFIGLLIVPFILFTKYQKVDIINSYHNTKEWNSSIDPILIGVISDLHISPFYPENGQSLIQIIHLLKNQINVEKIVCLGDLVENWGTNSTFRTAHQFEEDFIEYRNIIEKSYNLINPIKSMNSNTSNNDQNISFSQLENFLIEISGNHDEFSIEKYNSDNHYILKYSSFYQGKDEYKDYENFLISNFTYNDEIMFILLNLYHYPSPPARIGYFADLTREMLDIIEQKMNNLSNSNIQTRILLSHFPINYHNSWMKSSTKKTFQEILSSNNISLILSGHTHKHRTIHHNGTLEIISNSVMDNKAFGLLTIDNSRISFHNYSLNFDSDLYGAVTHPIPKHLLTKFTDFSEQCNEIRVIIFKKDPNLILNFSITNNSDIDSNRPVSLKGTLQFQRYINNQSSLYSSPLNLLNNCSVNNSTLDSGYDFFDGQFTLTFFGDWNYTMQFVVQNSVKLDKEMLENETNANIGICFINAIFWIVIIYILFPTKKCDPSYNFHGNIFVNIFGFIAIKDRIHKSIPKNILNIILWISFAPFIIPSIFLKVGGTYGFICTFGYFLQDVFVFDLWGLLFSSYFVFLVLLPSVLVFSIISLSISFIPYCIVSLFAIVIQLFLIIISIGIIVYQSTNFALAISSPFFGILPLILIALELRYFWFVIHIQMKTQSNEG